MTRCLQKYRLDEETEVVLLLAVGIVMQTTDGTPFNMFDKMNTIWVTDIPPELCTILAEHQIKLVVAWITILRCCTSPIYIVSAVLAGGGMIEEISSGFLYPFLVISLLKSIGFTLIEAMLGITICSGLHTIRRPCVEFLIIKTIEILSALYLWRAVLTRCKKLQILEEVQVDKQCASVSNMHLSSDTSRGPSISDELAIRSDGHLKTLQYHALPLAATEGELSLDSLHSTGLLLASVSDMGNFSELKMAHSLGDFREMKLNEEDDESATTFEKAKKILQITDDDVQLARNAAKTKNLFGIRDVNAGVWRDTAAARGCNIQEEVMRIVAEDAEGSEKSEDKTATGSASVEDNMGALMPLTMSNRAKQDEVSSVSAPIEPFLANVQGFLLKELDRNLKQKTENYHATSQLYGTHLPTASSHGSEYCEKMNPKRKSQGLSTTRVTSVRLQFSLLSAVPHPPEEFLSRRGVVFQSRDDCTDSSESSKGEEEDNDNEEGNYTK